MARRKMQLHQILKLRRKPGQKFGIQVPSKVKVFLWRLAQQSLPSTDLLHHRNMSTTSTCNICGMQDSWRHSLLDCQMARPEMRLGVS
jgi:hypothetical protein